jgi:hypothetical protein
MIQRTHFTYDPLSLVRLVMDMYAEALEGKHTKAVQFARYKYLHTMTDEELESHLSQYVSEEKIEEITLKDWKKDCDFLFKYVYETERYKALEFHFNKLGYGKTGLGVVDASDNTFYHCGFTQHWPTIMEVIKTKYSHFHKPLEEMYFNDRLNEHNGVTRKELDDFIITRFELIGETKRLDDYL